LKTTVRWAVERLGEFGVSGLNSLPYASQLMAFADVARRLARKEVEREQVGALYKRFGRCSADVSPAGETPASETLADETLMLRHPTGFAQPPIAQARDASANLSCLQTQRSHKILFPRGFIRVRPGNRAEKPMLGKRMMYP